MAAVRHLSNAPIVEATIELQVDASPTGKAQLADNSFAPIPSGYPQRIELFKGAFQIELGPTGATASKAEKAERIGFRFSSQDGQRLADFNTNAFAFHWLRPYTQWSDVRDEARRLWSIYVEALRPTAIVRIGVRYVNRVAVPVNAEDICDYLVPGPVVPDGLPQSIRAFLSRIELVNKATEDIGVITQAIQGQTADGDLSVLLDLDAIHMGSLDAMDDRVWSIADRLREFKNEMFFRSVTDALLEQYA